MIKGQTSKKAKYVSARYENPKTTLWKEGNVYFDLLNSTVVPTNRVKQHLTERLTQLAVKKIETVT